MKDKEKTVNELDKLINDLEYSIENTALLNHLTDNYILDSIESRQISNAESIDNIIRLGGMSAEEINKSLDYITKISKLINQL